MEIQEDLLKKERSREDSERKDKLNKSIQSASRHDRIFNNYQVFSNSTLKLSRRSFGKPVV